MAVATRKRATKGVGRASGEHRQATRVIALMMRLEAHRYPRPTSELADELGVSERQLRRDVAALAKAGQPVSLVVENGRSAVVLGVRARERIPMTIASRIALVAARNIFDAFEGTDLGIHIQTVVADVAQTLGPIDGRKLESLEHRIAYVADGGVKVDVPGADGVTGRNEDLLNDLVSGLMHNQCVSASYRSSRGNVRSGVFAPFGLALYRHGLYFVGSWDGKPEPRIFALERFSKTKILRKQAFVVPPEFRVSEFFQGAFGIWVSEAPEGVLLEFGPGSFETIAHRRYHASQRAERTERETTLMRLRVGITPDLVTWLLGWGDWVVVHEPEALRERVAEAHRSAVKKRVWQAARAELGRRG